MGAKHSKLPEPIVMIVPRQGEQRVRPSPSTRLPPRRRNVDYYRHDFDYYDSDCTSWHGRVPYLNREAVTIEGQALGFYKAPPSPHATSDQGSNDLNVPQGSRATTPVAPGSIPEDELRMLQGYKTIFVVDDSMWMYGGPWKRARRALSQLADLAGQYDESGIDIYFLNNRCWGGDLKDTTSVKQLFSSLEPYGHTPFRGRIRELLENYIEDMQTAGSTGPLPKPLIVVILMNEPPSDEAGDDNLAGVIRHYAKLMDERNHPLTQLGMHLVQVDSFRITKKYLQALDEDLKKPGDLRDMLDTTPGGDLTAEKMLKIVLDGVKRRADKQEKNGSG